MADKKNQDPDPPAENRTLKKRPMTFLSAAESKPIDRTSDDDPIMDLPGKDFKKPKHFSAGTTQPQIEAYYSVFRAITAIGAETDESAISYGPKILKGLREEWNISLETHGSLEDRIDKVLAQEIRASSAEKEMQEIEGKPMSKSSTSILAGSSWGEFVPESLNGQHIMLRNYDGRFKDFVIKGYDAEQGMHCVETTENSRWVDLSQVPTNNIMWGKGQKANFESSNNRSNDGFMLPMNKKIKLDQLQRKAYDDVIKVFKTEPSRNGETRLAIIKIMKEAWKIPQEPRTNQRTTSLVEQLRRKVPSASDEKEKQRVNAAKEQEITAGKGNPLTPHLQVSKEEKANPSSTSDDRNPTGSFSN